MDTIIIMETPVCCYRYDSDLKARAIFLSDAKLGVNDKRLSTKGTEEEEARWDAEIEARPDRNEWNWRCEILDGYLEREPLKTLVVIDYDVISAWLFIERIRRGLPPGDRWLFLSFFHSDEETLKMITGWKDEELLEEKAGWFAGITSFPFIKRIEIPYDMTLTEEYLRGLFNEYAMTKTPAELLAEIPPG